MARRWHKDFQLLIDPSEVSADYGQEDNSGTFQVSTINTDVPLKSTFSKSQKYKKILGCGQKLVALSLECDMPKFRRKVVVLELLLSYWERNCDVEIVPVQEDDTVVLVSKYNLMFIYSLITTGECNSMRG